MCQFFPPGSHESYVAHILSVDANTQLLPPRVEKFILEPNTNDHGLGTQVTPRNLLRCGSSFVEFYRTKESSKSRPVSNTLVENSGRWVTADAVLVVRLGCSLRTVLV